jgi:AraC-like DNA-binding protein
MRLFETFKPEHELLRKYISYYYLDIADDPDYLNEYVCYPHYNTTISVYKAHTCRFTPQHSFITAQSDAAALQIFTPIRTQSLKVTQSGPVHKIAIVFEPLGINQFLCDIGSDSKVSTLDFFSKAQSNALFKTKDLKLITALMDNYLLEKFTGFKNGYLEKALNLIHTSFDDISIEEIAENKLGVSRRQFNRLFQQHLGVTAQKYRAIVRFRQLMAHKLHEKEIQNFTSLSCQAHYTDQSHFIKSCKQLTGLSPKQFFNNGQIIGSEDTFWNFTRR